MARERRYSGVLWFLLWGAIVMLVTLVVDCLYVMWPYPHEPFGLDAFQDQVRREWGFLMQLCGDRLPPVAGAIHKGLHTVLFRWPGFDYMIARARDPAPMDAGGEMMRKAVVNSRELWGAALAGLQLFSARVAVVVLSAPLMGLLGFAGVADGLLGWFKRRSGGGRESGFVYHRAKRHAGHAALLLGFAYLAPPMFCDPRGTVTTVTLVAALCLRIAAASFKKYV
jgi:integrating conjugative element membrane protein (TIGR03747 family)